MSANLTAEDYRTASKVLRAHGEPSSADYWDQVAASMEAEAAEDAYIEELANLASGHSWVTIDDAKAVRAILAKLEADGRLRPPVVDAEVDEGDGPWATWQEVPSNVIYRAQSGVGRWVNDLGIRLATIDWEPSTYTEADMRNFAPFVRAEA